MCGMSVSEDADRPEWWNDLVDLATRQERGVRRAAQLLRLDWYDVSLWLHEHPADYDELVKLAGNFRIFHIYSSMTARPVWFERLLAEVAENGGNITVACEKIGVPFSAINRIRARWPDGIYRELMQAKQCAEKKSKLLLHGAKMPEIMKVKSLLVRGASLAGAAEKVGVSMSMLQRVRRSIPELDQEFRDAAAESPMANRRDIAKAIEPYLGSGDEVLAELVDLFTKEMTPEQDELADIALRLIHKRMHDSVGEWADIEL
jgi:hypothetical protein